MLDVRSVGRYWGKKLNLKSSTALPDQPSDLAPVGDAEFLTHQERCTFRPEVLPFFNRDRPSRQSRFRSGINQLSLGYREVQLFQEARERIELSTNPLTAEGYCH